MSIKIPFTIFSIVLFLASALSVAAGKRPPADGGTGVLSGVITDKADGKSIIGATVSIPDLHTGSITDANGHYAMLWQMQAGGFLPLRH